MHPSAIASEPKTRVRYKSMLGNDPNLRRWFLNNSKSRARRRRAKAASQFNMSSSGNILGFATMTCSSSG
jgi:hypothetical protein